MSNQEPNCRKLILFVDDDPSLRNLGRISLERAGYEFVGAPDGTEGLRRARELHPDLILLDYMMPGISGKEVFVTLAGSDDSRLRETPVVMLTAKHDNHDEQRELLELGMAAYLCKPFGHRELLNVIDNVLITAKIKERNRVLEWEARQSFVATVRALITLLSVKDNYTGEHSNVTADLAEALARRMNLTDTEIMHVKLGALLHDVGKIGVPELVLCKASCLTPEEMIVMRQHVHYGEQALAGVPHMETVRLIVKHHHEWWNGGGYPSGLKGHEIPLSTRIVTVTDAYHAMTSDRPYRRRLSDATAIERLRAAGGIQFDSYVVEKLVESLESHSSEQPRALNLQFLERLHHAA
ncbi:MAG: cyclic di-GMP phosphodiesterase [Acidobacteriota bacterium]|jgi:putative two-component system response regulator|nr:cyclic di-GMP phosphodiesterase [Acidobacteriota bacterium]